jgi:hypothetical protein
MDPVLLAVLLAAAVVAAVVIYWFVRTRSRKAEDPLVNFRCPHCKRRLHYRKSKAGHRGMCPRCRHHLVFPIVPEAE